MTHSPQIRKLLPKALHIEGSEVPLHRVLDVLSSEHGDISEAVNRFGDLRNRELRRAIHACAELLRALEAEAGLTPAWEPDRPGAGGQGTGSSAKPKSERSAKASKYDISTFVRLERRGQIAAARLYTDGASKGNPGPAGIGYLIQTSDGDIVAQGSESIGEATNNVAEYKALIRGLETAVELAVGQLEVVGDSELVIKQMSGVYAIKHPDMKPLALQAQRLARQLGKVTWRHVPRDQNAHADALSTASIPK
jgi:ribonuclease HI